MYRRPARGAKTDGVGEWLERARSGRAEQGGAGGRGSPSWPDAWRRAAPRWHRRPTSRGRSSRPWRLPVKHEIPANDDQYSPGRPAVPVNFYGQDFEHLWVNNNGNVTFDGPLGTYTPFGLDRHGRPIIAPFFADVDTRGRRRPSTLRLGQHDLRGPPGLLRQLDQRRLLRRAHRQAEQLPAAPRRSARTPGRRRLRHRLQLRARSRGRPGTPAAATAASAAPRPAPGSPTATGVEGTSYELAGLRASTAACSTATPRPA